MAPIPYRAANVLTPESRASPLTLTTCHPKLSARLRMIIHAVLTDRYENAPGAGCVNLPQKRN